MEAGAAAGGPRSRLFRQFKNPPQPHMCIEERAGPDALYINVLAWQKIASPERCSDPIPLYGGMQVPQSCSPSSKKPPLLVFAVMVNPEILKTSGKNAANPMDREALVSLLCDFVEAMNPGLQLARNPVILKDRDLAGELKDVWLAVQNKREREKGMNQDFLYKVYDIDGVQNDETGDEDRLANSYQDNQNTSNYYSTQDQDTSETTPPKSSKQILKNAGQLSEFDSGMNNYQLNQCSSALQNYIEARDSVITSTINNTTCTQAYGQIMSTRENHQQVNDLHHTFPILDNLQPSNPFRKEMTVGPTGNTGWDEYSKKDVSTINNGKGDYGKQKRIIDNQNNGKDSYKFFPVFHTAAPPTLASPALAQSQTSTVKSVAINNEQNKMNTAQNNGDNTDKIIDPMRKLVLHSTDNKICDNKKS